MDRKLLKKVRIVAPMSVWTETLPKLDYASLAEPEDVTRELLIDAFVGMIKEDLYDLSKLEVEFVE
jgi:hypothetical protein